MLILGLTNKYGIVVYSEMLYYPICRGIEVLKIHRVLEFEGLDFLYPYISLILTLRRKANQKNGELMYKTYKKMANGLLGRLQCDSTNKSDFQFSLTREKSFKLIRNGSYEDYLLLKSDVALFRLSKRTINYSGALLPAACILSQSKIDVFRRFEMF
jgi:hypothetical protein